MRFEELYQQRIEKKLTVEDAAKLLGVHERTFRRWCTRYEESGSSGLADRRLERMAHNAAPVDEVMEVITLFETHYPNFTIAHFYDIWRQEHSGQRSYTWVKKTLQDSGLVKKAKRRGAHRRKRPREAMRGMMLHQDGSNHDWIANHRWDLIVTMDDATNEIYSAFFVEEEGTWSSFRGVKEVIENQGLFCSLYTDRGTHYWYTPEVGGKVDKKHCTQFRRAMKRLGIEMIAAYSPEARGRSERMFGTLQGRLPKELALASIGDMDKANQFLEKQFLPAFNQRFSVKPASSESAFVPWLPGNLQLDDILCIQETRTVKKDNTVSYRNKCLQIPADEHRCHYTKTTVTIHEYSDGSTAIYYGPRHLADYDRMGQYIGKGAISSPQRAA